MTQSPFTYFTTYHGNHAESINPFLRQIFGCFCVCPTDFNFHNYKLHRDGSMELDVEDRAASKPAFCGNKFAVCLPRANWRVFLLGIPAICQKTALCKVHIPWQQQQQEHIFLSFQIKSLFPASIYGIKSQGLGGKEKASDSNAQNCLLAFLPPQFQL